MIAATTTPATTAHACTLAGGIRASLDPAVFGWTLTLSDELRALTLTLLPDQVAEMATWRGFGPNIMDNPESRCMTLLSDCDWLISTARFRAGDDVTRRWQDDLAALRGLAAAALGEGDR